MPILLSSAYGTIQTAVDAIKKGAYYYFEKPVDRARLLIIVERAIENLHLRESHRVLSEKLFPAPSRSSASMRRSARSSGSFRASRGARAPSSSQARAARGRR